MGTFRHRAGQCRRPVLAHDEQLACRWCNGEQHRRSRMVWRQRPVPDEILLIVLLHVRGRLRLSDAVR